MEGKITAEWEKLRKVVVHRPGIELFFGLLDPTGSLYERAFSQNLALKEHEQLVDILSNDLGVKVEMLYEGIAKRAKSGRKRKMLESAAFSSIDFIGTDSEVKKARKEFIQNLSSYDEDYLINIILLMPRLFLKKSRGIGSIHLSVTERDPLSNLYFMRDQQLVADKGLFISRMAKQQRRNETRLTSMLWEMMGLPISHKAKPPATIEGGDFFPMGDFALIGSGDRTNKNGILQFMKYGISSPEIGIVSQPANPLIPSSYKDPMLDMHLDTYFNVAGKELAVGSETLLKLAEVELYEKAGGRYEKKKGKSSLWDYLKSKGFEIINLSVLEQMSYASNFLCINDKKILAVESSAIIKKTASRISKLADLEPKHYGPLNMQIRRDYASLSQRGTTFPNRKKLSEYGIDGISIDLSNLTGGYGGAHCMTAAIYRN
jgi:arginine deiminase